jgi:hypothetical protein
MPQLDELLAKAQQKEPKKTFTRGNRPDRIALGNFPLPESPLGSEQSRAKVETEPEPKVESKWSQSEAKVETAKIKENRSRAKVETEPEPKVESKWSQSEAKVETEVEPTAHFSSVVGLQRKALFCLYESCRFSGSKISLPFAIQNIADACGTSISAVKKALQRLERKHFLHRAEYKDGRSGWTRYQLSSAVYNSLLQTESGAKLESKWSQSEVKVGTKVGTKVEPSAPSSSSKDLDLITTTTGPSVKSGPSPDVLAPEWGAVDISSLGEVRFSRNQVKQIADQGLLTPEQLQESIYAFAFDLRENGKARELKSPPVNYFMGILRRGPYAPPANYESQEERQARLFLESKNARQQERRDRVKKIKEAEFEEWLIDLPKEERVRLTPIGTTDMSKRTQLWDHFENQVWRIRLKALCERGELPEAFLFNGDDSI